MKDSKGILDKINHKDGLTVPEGYFADFAKMMAEKLPERPEVEQPAVAPKSMWVRVKPYVYMAAMFAGVWCMLKMFMLMSTTPQDLSIDNMPDLATAVENEQFVEDYIIDDISGYDIFDQMVTDSIPIGDIEDSLYVFESVPHTDYDEAAMTAPDANPILP